MNNPLGSFEENIEQGVRSASDSAKKQVTAFGKTAIGQVTGSQQPQAPSDSTTQSGKMSDEDAKKFLKDLYGPTNPTVEKKEDKEKPKEQPKPESLQTIATGTSPKNPNEGKKPEEIAQIESLRRQLHGDYYQTLVNRPPEEHVAEKLEREDTEKKISEFEEEKKKPKTVLPPGTKQGTGETSPGAVG